MFRLIPLLTLFIFATGPVWAQFSQGERFIGGGFSFEPSLSGPKQTSVSIEPEYGVFRSPKVAVGIALGVSVLTFKSTNSDINRNETTVGLYPYIQRFVPIVSQFGIVLSGRAGLSYSASSESRKSWNQTQETTESAISLGVSGSPGLFYRVNPRWLLLFDIGTFRALNVSTSTKKSTNDSQPNNDTQTNSTTYGLGNTYSIGSSAIRIRYFLR